MKYLVLCLFLSGIMVACKKENKQPDSSGTGDDKALLIGQWRWILQFDDGFYSDSATSNPANDSLTPANTGIKRVLAFNNNNTWTLTQNGSLAQSGTFKYVTWPTPGGLITSLDFVKNDGTDSMVNHEIFNDTLYIASQLVVGVHTARLYVKNTGYSQQ